MNTIDDFITNLQDNIFDEAKEAYGEKGFQRWRHPRYCGRIENPDGYARVSGTCGDTMEIFLKIENDRVIHASYITNGCASSSICGSFAAELAIDKYLDEVTDITAEAILKQIGRLPPEDSHCTTLAAETVQEALNNYMANQ
jgi:nitrogen fixation protein NifU and related proteins